MPAPERLPFTRPRPQPSSDAIERLYVYWLVSTVLLLLVAVILTVFARGAMRQQTGELHALSGRVAALEELVGGSAVTPPPRATQHSLAGATTQPTETRPAPTTRAARPPAPGASAPATAPEATGPPEAAIQSQLDEVAGDRPGVPADLRDPQAATALVDSALKQIGRARWSGETWARLAVVARLVGRDASAEAFARRAAAAGDPLVEYTEVSARAALAHGRPHEALPLVGHLVEQTGGAPTAELLLSAALLATDQPGTAAEALELLGDVDALSTRDKLLLGHLLVQLQDWQRLDDVLTTIQDVAEELAAEHQFLQAVSLARAGQTAKALAILDYLEAHLPESRRGAEEGAGTASGPTTLPATAAWAASGPDRYETELWRGVTLLRAKQPETARQALERAARLDPGRPDAHYWLGMLEYQLGQRERAAFYLKNALASSARMAPAWEALALTELDAGQITPAVEHLAKALEINPRRASAHFAMAIAQAKLSQKEAAAAALQAAFRLDEGYLAEARQTDVLTRLFTADELDQLAAETTGSRPAAETTRPASGGQP